MPKTQYEVVPLHDIELGEISSNDPHQKKRHALNNFLNTVEQELKNKSCFDYRFRNRGSLIALLVFAGLTFVPLHFLPEKEDDHHSALLVILPMLAISGLMTAYIAALKYADRKPYLFVDPRGIERFYDLPLRVFSEMLCDDFDQMKSVFEKENNPFKSVTVLSPLRDVIAIAKSELEKIPNNAASNEETSLRRGFSGSYGTL